MVGRRSVPPASLIPPPTVDRPQFTGQAGVHHAERDLAVLSSKCRGHPDVDLPLLSRSDFPSTTLDKSKVVDPFPID